MASPRSPTFTSSSPNSLLRRDVLTALVGYGIPPLLSLVTQVLLARSLGAEGRGLVAGALAPMLLLTAVATMGLPESITHHLAARGRSDAVMRAIRKAFLALIGVGLLATLVWIAVELLSRNAGPARDAAVVAACAVTPLLVIAGLRSIAGGEHRWKLVALERVLGSLLQLALIIAVFVGAGLEVISATSIVAFSQIPAALVYVALVRRAPRPSGDRQQDVALHTFGIRVWLGSLAGVLLTRLDQVLMVPLAGAKALGVYAVAVPLAESVLLANVAIRDVLFARQSENPSIEQLAKASRMSTTFVFATAVVVGIASIWFVPLVFGSEFSAAVPVLVILMLASVLGNPGSIAAMGLSARGMPERRSIAIVIGLLVNVVFMLALVPPLQEIGAALASLIAYPVSGWLGLLFLRNHSQIRIRDFIGIRRDDARSILLFLHLAIVISVGTVVTRVLEPLLMIRNRRSKASVLGDAPVIVSLTTYGTRMSKVFLAIEAIGRGSVRPQQLILWLDDAAALANPPVELRRLMGRGLQLRSTEDFGPHKKYFPALKLAMGGNSLGVVTADDDVLYPRDWLRQMLGAVRESPNTVVGHRVRRMVVTDAGIAPYDQWEMCTTTSPSSLNVATGVSGVFYPRPMLEALISAGQGFTKVAPRADDLWLHHVAFDSGIPVRQVKALPGRFAQIRGSQKEALAISNARHGGNDTVLVQLYTRDDVRRLIEADNYEALFAATKA